MVSVRVCSRSVQNTFCVEETSVRLTFGVAILPLGIPIELEIIFEVSD
jgi:hypothetical protein